MSLDQLDCSVKAVDEAQLLTRQILDQCLQN